jgi:hypothetical protein
VDLPEVGEAQAGEDEAEREPEQGQEDEPPRPHDASHPARREAETALAMKEGVDA